MTGSKSFLDCCGPIHGRHSLRQIRKAPRKGRFAYVAERKGCRGHAGSTDSPGANPDSRMAGPGARRAEGLGAWMHSTIQGHRSLSSRSAPSGAFGVSGGEKRVPTPRGFDGFDGSESGQPNGWPWSAPGGRVGCMDAPNNPRPPIAISTERPGRGGRDVMTLITLEYRGALRYMANRAQLFTVRKTCCLDTETASGQR